MITGFFVVAPNPELLFQKKNPNKIISLRFDAILKMTNAQLRIDPAAILSKSDLTIALSNRLSDDSPLLEIIKTEGFKYYPENMDTNKPILVYTYNDIRLEGFNE